MTLEDVCRGVGVRDINVVNAFDLELIQSTIKRCTETPEPSVIIARGDCVLNRRVRMHRMPPS